MFNIIYIYIYNTEQNGHITTLNKLNYSKSIQTAYTPPPPPFSWPDRHDNIDADI